jgi:type I restriction enzyme, S subunit
VTSTTVHKVAEVILGRQRNPQSDTGPHMVRYLRAANVKDGLIDLTDVKSMNFSPSEQQVFALRRGDVLVSEGSGSLSAVGASAVWNEELTGRICFQNTLLRLRPRPDADSRYLGWWARSAHASGLFASIATGANIYHLSAERFRSLPIDLPAVVEQQRIADFLDAETARIDALTDTQLRVLDLLAARRVSFAHAAVTGASHAAQRPTSLAWSTALPVDWYEAKVSLLARMGSGHTPSRSREDWWTDCKIPWITTGEVSQVRDDRAEQIFDTREKISSAGLANSSAELCARGTVVLCRTASAGYSAVMGTDMATSQDFVTWQCGARLDPFYLLWCLRAMRSDLLGRLAMGSTHKTIYVPDLQMLRIPVPPIDEQREIVASIRRANQSIDTVLDKVRLQIELLAERRQALITAAVTGQFDVTTARGADLS